MEFLPLSALQHLLYCDRQCALIHIEQAWAENQFTAEGQVLHEKAHTGVDEARPGVRIIRTLAVKSEALGLSGLCDVVEFHANGIVLPIEYKRGKPKAHRADEVQLCAQALCLEESLKVYIPEGRLFYGQTRRRTDVIFDSKLRELTQNTTRQLHELIIAADTPPALYERRKCEACSLKDLCLPGTSKRKQPAQAWFSQRLVESLSAT